MQDYYSSLRDDPSLVTNVKLPYQVRHLSLDDLRVQRFSKASHDYKSNPGKRTSAPTGTHGRGYMSERAASTTRGD